MFKDIYTTTPCSTYNMGLVYQGIKEAHLSDALRLAVTEKGENVSGVWVLTSQDKTTPAFAHPIITKLMGTVDRVAIDARAFTRIDPKTGKLLVTGMTEYDFAILRARLQEAWVNGNARDMINFGQIAPKVFTRWVSEGIARRLNLTPLEQLQCAVVAGLYYYQLFGENLSDEQTRYKVASQVSRVTSIAADKVIEIANEMTPFMPENLGERGPSIHNFVAAVKLAVASPRIDSLSPVLLYAILGGSWFGANAREIVAIALEHPPTFLAIVYTALTNRTYHRSFMAQLVSMCDRQNNGKLFVTSVDQFLGNINHV